MKTYRKCGIILARGGSKGIPRKNMQFLGNKTLLEHVIDAAKGSVLKQIWVSSEDNEIKGHCEKLGVHVYNRPVHLAQDLSTDFECLYNFLTSHANEYDYLVHLRATFPKISAEIINDAIQCFEDRYDEIDSLRSVIPASQSPYKMWFTDKDGCLQPVISDNHLHSSPRQILPPAFFQNACIDIVKTRTICSKNDIIGSRCFAYLMDENYNFDIDTQEDLKKLRD